jgi:hypothetical protein
VNENENEERSDAQGGRERLRPNRAARVTRALRVEPLVVLLEEPYRPIAERTLKLWPAARQKNRSEPASDFRSF